MGQNIANACTADDFCLTDWVTSILMGALIREMNDPELDLFLLFKSDNFKVTGWREFVLYFGFIANYDDLLIRIKFLVRCRFRLIYGILYI